MADPGVSLDKNVVEFTSLGAGSFDIRGEGINILLNVDVSLGADRWKRIFELKKTNRIKFSLISELFLKLTTPAAQVKSFPHASATPISTPARSALMAVFMALKRGLMTDNCWLTLLVTRDDKSVMFLLIDASTAFKQARDTGELAVFKAAMSVLTLVYQFAKTARYGARIEAATVSGLNFVVILVPIELVRAFTSVVSCAFPIALMVLMEYA